MKIQVLIRVLYGVFNFVKRSRPDLTLGKRLHIKTSFFSRTKSPYTPFIECEFLLNVFWT